MADITYCISDCPFADCKRHKSKIEIAANEGRKYVRVADHAPVCRRYIASVVEEVMSSECKETSEKNRQSDATSAKSRRKKRKPV